MSTGAFVWGDSLPTLPGGRVALRPLVATDAPAMLATFGDTEVLRYWGGPVVADLPAAQALIADIDGAFRERRLFQWAVAGRDTGLAVGTCTLYQLDREHGRAEIGFALRRSAWGTGLMSEALDVLLAFAFGPLGLHRLEADVDPRNHRSLRALERKGFRREGHLRQRWRIGGEWHDAVFLGLLAPEWPGV